MTVGEDTVTVTGWVLANALLDQLYSPSTFETLPRVIGNIRAGDEAALSGILDTGLSSYAWLMRISVWCNEEVPFQDAGAVARQVEAYPLFQGVDQSTVPQGLCAAAGFGDAAPPARADAPVETDVPVLIIAGALDPATPPAWQKEMVAHLPAGRLVLFPSGGHGVFTPCSGALSTAFWQDPAGPLPAECVLEDTGPDFARAAE